MWLLVERGKGRLQPQMTYMEIVGKDFENYIHHVFTTLYKRLSFTVVRVSTKLYVQTDFLSYLDLFALLPGN